MRWGGAVGLLLFGAASGAAAAPASKVVRALLEVDRGEVIASGGGLLVVDVGDGGHDLRLVDPAHKRTLALSDTELVDSKRRAVVRPFLGARGLVDVVVTVDGGPTYRRERHLLVRTSGPELTLACEVEGSTVTAPEPTTEVTLRRAPVDDKPGTVTFDVDTRVSGRTRRVRYTLDAEGGCGGLGSGGVDGAAVPAAVERAARAALAARGETLVRILEALADGRLIVEAEKDEARALLLVAAGARPRVVVLEPSFGAVHRQTTEVAAAPFLGRTGLEELTVHASWSTGMGGGGWTRHYLLRGGARAPEVACRFDGDAGHGMEDVSESTRTRVEKTGEAPLTFRVHARTAGSRSMSPARAAVTECRVPERGECSCETRAERGVGGGP